MVVVVVTDVVFVYPPVVAKNRQLEIKGCYRLFIFYRAKPREASLLAAALPHRGGASTDTQREAAALQRSPPGDRRQ